MEPTEDQPDQVVSSFEYNEEYTTVNTNKYKDNEYFRDRMLASDTTIIEDALNNLKSTLLKKERVREQNILNQDRMHDPIKSVCSCGGCPLGSQLTCDEEEHDFLKTVYESAHLQVQDMLEELQTQQHKFIAKRRGTEKYVLYTNTSGVITTDELDTESNTETDGNTDTNTTSSTSTSSDTTDAPESASESQSTSTTDTPKAHSDGDRDDASLTNSNHTASEDTEPTKPADIHSVPENDDANTTTVATTSSSDVDVDIVLPSMVDVLSADTPQVQYTDTLLHPLVIYDKKCQLYDFSSNILPSGIKLLGKGKFFLEDNGKTSLSLESNTGIVLAYSDLNLRNFDNTKEPSFVTLKEATRRKYMMNHAYSGSSGPGGMSSGMSSSLASGGNSTSSSLSAQSNIPMGSFAYGGMASGYDKYKKVTKLDSVLNSWTIHIELYCEHLPATPTSLLHLGYAQVYLPLLQQHGANGNGNNPSISQNRTYKSLTTSDLFILPDGRIGVLDDYGDTSVKLVPQAWNKVTVTYTEKPAPDLAVYINNTLGCSLSERAELQTRYSLKGGVFSMFTSPSSVNCKHTNLFRVNNIRVYDRVLTLDEIKETLPIVSTNAWSMLTQQQDTQIFKALALAPLLPKPPAIWSHPVYTDLCTLQASSQYTNVHFPFFAFLASQIPKSLPFLMNMITAIQNNTCNDGTTTSTTDTVEHSPISRGHVVSFTRSLCNAFLHFSKTKITSRYDSEIIQTLSTLPEQSYTFVPIPMLHENTQDPAQPYKSCIIFIVERIHRDRYHVALANTSVDCGLRHHSLTPVYPHDLHTASPHYESNTMYANTVIPLCDVSLQRITNPVFWSCVVSVCMDKLPSGFMNSSILYHRILPYLWNGTWEDVVANLEVGQNSNINLTSEQALCIPLSSPFVIDYHEISALGSFTNTILHSVFYMARRHGFSRVASTLLMNSIKYQCMFYTYNDLLILPSLGSSDYNSIMEMIRHSSCITADITSYIQTLPSEVQSHPHVLEYLQSIYLGTTRITSYIQSKCPSYSDYKLLHVPPKYINTYISRSFHKAHFTKQASMYPYLHDVLKYQDTSHLVGTNINQHSSMNVDVSTLPMLVYNISDIIYSMSVCIDICTRLMTRSDVLLNYNHLIFTTISKLLTQVIPVPKHIKPGVEVDASKDTNVYIWNSGMTSAQQAQLLGLLSKLSEYILLCYGTFPTNVVSSMEHEFLNHATSEIVVLPHSHSTECSHSHLLVLQLITAVIADYVIHQQCIDKLNPITNVLTFGSFGIGIHNLATLTENCIYYEPEYAIARSLCLRYIMDCNYQNTLFDWKSGTMDQNVVFFFAYVCETLNYPLPQDLGSVIFAHGDQLDRGLASYYIANYHSEMYHYRDILTALRIIALPRFKYVTQGDKPTVDSYRVTYIPFGSDIHVQCGSFQISFSKHYFTHLPSYSSPNEIVYKTRLQQHILSGTTDVFEDIKITTEEDVLHLTSLPDFNGQVHPQDSERILSILTAPYIRIPLLLEFLTESGKLHSLLSHALMKCIFNSLFEPGRFEYDISLAQYQLSTIHSLAKTGVPPPQTDGTTSTPDYARVPYTNDMIGTPFGLLMNELYTDPKLITDLVTRLLQETISLDTGTPHNTSTTIVLFIIKIAIGVVKYLQWLYMYTKNSNTLYANQTLAFLVDVKHSAAPSSDVLHECIVQLTSILAVIQDKVLLKWLETLFVGVKNTIVSKSQAVKKTEDQSVMWEKIESEMHAIRRNYKASKNKTSAGKDVRFTDDSIYMNTTTTTTTTTSGNTKSGAGAGTSTGSATSSSDKTSYEKYNDSEDTLNAVEQMLTGIQNPNDTFMYDPEDLNMIVSMANSIHQYNLLCSTILLETSLDHPVVHPLPCVVAPIQSIASEILSAGDQVVDKPAAKTTAPITYLSDSVSSHHYYKYVTDLRTLHTTNQYSIYHAHIVTSMIYLQTRHNWLNTLTVPDLIIFHNVMKYSYQRVYHIQQYTKTTQHLILQSIAQVVMGSIAYVDTHALTQNMTKDDMRIDTNTNTNTGTWTAVQYSNTTPSNYVCVPHTSTSTSTSSSSTNTNPNTDRNVEIDIQTCQVTLKSSHLIALPTQIANDSIVKEHLGDASSQCAVIDITKNRTWYRVIGRNLDIFYWRTLDKRVPEIFFDRLYEVNDLHSQEKWIVEIFEPIRLQYYNDPMDPTPVYMSSSIIKATSNVAHLLITKQSTQSAWKHVFVYKHTKHVEIFDIFTYGRKYYKTLTYTNNIHFCYGVLAIDTQRDAPWDTWQRHEAGDAKSTQPNMLDCIIERDVCMQPDIYKLDSISKTKERFIPPRLLHGVIPNALLELYQFWQDDMNTIIGYPLHPYKNPHILQIYANGEQLHNEHDHILANGIVRRVPLSIWREYFVDQSITDHPSIEELVDVHSISPANELYQTMLILAYFDTFANVLVWKKTCHERYNINIHDTSYSTSMHDSGNAQGFQFTNTGSIDFADASKQQELLDMYTQNGKHAQISNRLSISAITVIEIPRLNLSFAFRQELDGTVQLYSLDHTHTHISLLQYHILLFKHGQSYLLQEQNITLSPTEHENAQALLKLLAHLPRCLLLQTPEGSYSIVTPVLEPVCPNIPSRPLSTEVLYPSSEWLQQSPSPYFVYKIHVTLDFLTTQSTSSSLFLLLHRYIAGDYTGCVQLIDSCTGEEQFDVCEMLFLNKILQTRIKQNADAYAFMYQFLYNLRYCEFVLPYIYAVVGRYSGFTWSKYTSVDCKITKSIEMSMLQIILQNTQIQATADVLLPNVREDTGNFTNTFFPCIIYNRHAYLTKTQGKSFLYMSMPGQHVYTTEYLSSDTEGIVGWVQWYEQGAVGGTKCATKHGQSSMDSDDDNDDDRNMYDDDEDEDEDMDDVFMIEHYEDELGIPRTRRLLKKPQSSTRTGAGTGEHGEDEDSGGHSGIPHKYSSDVNFIMEDVQIRIMEDDLIGLWKKCLTGDILQGSSIYTLYNILTGEIPVFMCNQACNYEFIKMVLYLLDMSPSSTTAGLSIIWDVLRIGVYHPYLISYFPKLNCMMSCMSTGAPDVTSTMIDCIYTLHTFIQAIPQYMSYTPVVHTKHAYNIHHVTDYTVTQDGTRCHVRMNISNCDMSALPIYTTTVYNTKLQAFAQHVQHSGTMHTFAEDEHLTTQPLFVYVEEYIGTLSRADMLYGTNMISQLYSIQTNNPTSSTVTTTTTTTTTTTDSILTNTLGVDLRKHASSKTLVAENLLGKFDEDLQYYHTMLQTQMVSYLRFLHPKTLFDHLHSRDMTSTNTFFSDVHAHIATLTRELHTDISETKNTLYYVREIMNMLLHSKLISAKYDDKELQLDTNPDVFTKTHVDLDIGVHTHTCFCVQTYTTTYQTNSNTDTNTTTSTSKDDSKDDDNSTTMVDALSGTTTTTTSTEDASPDTVILDRRICPAEQLTQDTLSVYGVPTETDMYVYELNSYANREAKTSMKYIVSLLLSTKLYQDLHQVIPFVCICKLELIFMTACMHVLYSTKLDILNRLLGEVHSLQRMVYAAQNTYTQAHGRLTIAQLEELYSSFIQKSTTICNLMKTKRAYTIDTQHLTPDVSLDTSITRTNTNTSTSAATHPSPRYFVDARFFTFEFASSIMLRESQVDMLHAFTSAIRQGNSRVQQLIMGAGKTTVVSPLLALILSTGKQMVVQVVPPALLRFSTTVLRSCFSSMIHKQVCTFSYERGSKLVSKDLIRLRECVNNRGIILSTPTSIKSVLLKYLELVSELENHSSSNQNLLVIEEEVMLLRELLLDFKRGYLLIDEVDLVLHPLKSELNFPLGSKFPLDLAPLRWQLVAHIMDGFLCASNAAIHQDTTSVHASAQKYLHVNLRKDTYVLGLLDKITKCIIQGSKNVCIQYQPHVTLLDVEWYHMELKPLLTEWLTYWLAQKHIAMDTSMITMYLTLDERALVSILKTHSNTSTSKNTSKNNSIDSMFAQQCARLSSEHIQLLTLSRTWLHNYLPHCLSRICHVHYGILTPTQSKNLLLMNPNMPTSRLYLAIPFIGKDTPSHASEFAHPDITIGFTYLAYHYQGLRFNDVLLLIDNLQSQAEGELGNYNNRPSCLKYTTWITEQGATVRSTLLPSSTNKNDTSTTPSTTSDTLEVLPLRLMKRSNHTQMNQLYSILEKSSSAIYYYINELILPTYLRFQNQKLSACGVDLGGSMLFERRIGFSGTPSNLLPLSLGVCHHQRTADAQVLSLLTDAHHTSVLNLDRNWNAKELLRTIATMRDGNGKLVYRALIDTGALITGYSNEQAARMLLEFGLEGIDGVVFLAEDDKKLVLVRATGRVAELEQCGVPVDRRFTFYDQVHTTGMDISQSVNAKACITLSKDMVWRDYAQGAYRMRGIGQGQKLTVVVPPEVIYEMKRKLTNLHITNSTNGDTSTNTTVVDESMYAVKNVEIFNPTILKHICSWLLINSVCTENLQYSQLVKQNIMDVWRQGLVHTLLHYNNKDKSSDKSSDKKPSIAQLIMQGSTMYMNSIPKDVYAQLPPTHPTIEAFLVESQGMSTIAHTTYKDCVRGLFDVVHTNIPDILPHLQDLQTSLLQTILEHVKHMDVKQQAICGRLVHMNTTLSSEEDMVIHLQTEMTQTAEEEKEKEQEQEQEKEVELEKFVDIGFSRENETPTTWSLKYLHEYAIRGEQLTSQSPFFYAKDWNICESNLTLPFTEGVQLTCNYYNPTWTGARKLKNTLTYIYLDRGYNSYTSIHDHCDCPPPLITMSDDIYDEDALFDSIHMCTDSTWMTEQPTRQIISEFIQACPMLIPLQLVTRLVYTTIGATDVDIHTLALLCITIRVAVNSAGKLFTRLPAPKQYFNVYDIYIPKNLILRLLSHPYLAPRQYNTKGACAIATSLSECQSLRKATHLGKYIWEKQAFSASVQIRSLYGLLLSSTRNVEEIDVCKTGIPATTLPLYYSNLYDRLRLEANLKFLDVYLYPEYIDTSHILTNLGQVSSHTRILYMELLASCRRRVKTEWRTTPFRDVILCPSLAYLMITSYYSMLLLSTYKTCDKYIKYCDTNLDTYLDIYEVVASVFAISPNSSIVDILYMVMYGAYNLAFVASDVLKSGTGTTLINTQINALLHYPLEPSSSSSTPEDSATTTTTTNDTTSANTTQLPTLPTLTSEQKEYIDVQWNKIASEHVPMYHNTSTSSGSTGRSNTQSSVSQTMNDLALRRNLRAITNATLSKFKKKPVKSTKTRGGTSTSTSGTVEDDHGNGYETDGGVGDGEYEAEPSMTNPQVLDNISSYDFASHTIPSGITILGDYSMRDDPVGYDMSYLHLEPQAGIIIPPILDNPSVDWTMSFELRLPRTAYIQTTKYVPYKIQEDRTLMHLMKIYENTHKLHAYADTLIQWYTDNKHLVSTLVNSSINSTTNTGSVETYGQSQEVYDTLLVLCKECLTRAPRLTMELLLTLYVLPVSDGSSNTSTSTIMDTKLLHLVVGWKELIQTHVQSTLKKMRKHATQERCMRVIASNYAPNTYNYNLGSTDNASSAYGIMDQTSMFNGSNIASNSHQKVFLPTDVWFILTITCSGNTFCAYVNDDILCQNVQKLNLTLREPLLLFGHRNPQACNTSVDLRGFMIVSGSMTEESIKEFCNGAELQPYKWTCTRCNCKFNETTTEKCFKCGMRRKL